MNSNAEALARVAVSVVVHGAGNSSGQ